MAKKDLRQPASRDVNKTNRLPTIHQDHLKAFYAELNNYIVKKELLTRDNLVSFSLRGSFFGLFTSLIPPVSLVNLLRNFGEKKGMLYKTFHWFTPYKPGARVVLPNFRAFVGAKVKDWLSSRANRDHLIIRQRNMGYANLLTVKIDFLLYGKPKPGEQEHKKFKQFVADQIQIKQGRLQFDSYYRLLQRINSTIISSTHLRSTRLDSESRKLRARILDSIAESTVRNDFTRGKDYNFDTIAETFRIDDFKTEALTTTYTRLHSLLFTKDSVPVEVNLPQQEVSVLPEPIKLSSGYRAADKFIGMKLDPETYRDFVITGVDNQHRIVGKDSQLLPNGWYQFAITKENGVPKIRYFPCAESRTPGLIPFSEQRFILPKKSGDYYKQNCKVPTLRYEKYITHSELAGGVDTYGAGAFAIVDGAIKIIEDSSGHYPVVIPKNAKEKTEYNHFKYLEFTHSLLKSYGANVSDAILEHWKDYHGFGKICKKSAAVASQAFISKGTAEIAPMLAEMRPTIPERRSASPIRKLIEISSPPTMRCR